MAIDSTLAPYVPKSFYGADGQLSVPGDTTTADSETTASAVAGGIKDFVATLPAADAAAFMAIVNATGPATLAPGGKVASDLTTRLEGIEAGMKAFQSMLVSTNDFDMLARVMIEQYGEQRHEAVNDRQQMRQLAQAELQASAGQLQKEASDMMSGAIASLVLSCVAAAVSIGMSASALGGQLKSLKSEMNATQKLAPIEGELASRTEGTEGAVGGSLAGGKGATEGEGELGNVPTKELYQMKAEANIELKKAEATNAKFQFMGQMGGALGRLGEAGANAASTLAQAQAKQEEAQGKLDDAQAESLNAQGDLKKAIVDALDDMIKQLIASVKDLQEAKAERMRAFSRI